MNVTIFACVALCTIVTVYSQPIELEEMASTEKSAQSNYSKTLEAIDEPLAPAYQENRRVKRFTCDVLSVEAKGIALNHSACGVHCLIKGRSGGYCNDQRVCVCR